jgi:signal transduction histidine kinase
MHRRRPGRAAAGARAAQEALANVARHAHATRVGLTSYMENEVAMDVTIEEVLHDLTTNSTLITIWSLAP